MSTKTTFKRIALVTVAALGISFTAVAPSNAVTNGIIADSFTAAGAATAATSTTVGTASTVAVTYSGIAAASTDVATVGGSVQSSPLTSSAVTITYADTASATQVNSTFSSPTITASAAGRATRYLTASFTPDVAGTYVLKLTSAGAVNNAYVTWTITATAVGAVTAADSTSINNAGEVVNGTADAVVSASKTIAASAQKASIVVTAKNAAGTDLTSSTILTATITGPGSLGIDTAANVASIAATGRAITGTAGQNVIGVFSDGTAGVATITISAGTTVLSTETVTFYGSLATLTASVKKPVAGTGTATTGAIEVIGKDASGVVVPSVGLTITSGTTTTVASYTATSSSQAEVTAGTASVSVTGIATKFGSVVLTIADTATGLVTTTATVTVSSEEAAAVTVAFDKSEYAPGEKATLTISAKDANGLVVANTLANTGDEFSWSTNVATVSTLPVAAAFANGVQTVTVYMPATSGVFTVTGKLLAGTAWATALDDTTVSASATVLNPAADQAQAATDAAAEATDAANAATDAANAAAEAADAATAAAQDAADAVAALSVAVTEMITALKKQITALTNLVIKIQKKVKA